MCVQVNWLLSFVVTAAAAAMVAAAVMTATAAFNIQFVCITNANYHTSANTPESSFFIILTVEVGVHECDVNALMKQTKINMCVKCPFFLSSLDSATAMHISGFDFRSFSPHFGHFSSVLSARPNKINVNRIHVCACSFFIATWMVLHAKRKTETKAKKVEAQEESNENTQLKMWTKKVTEEEMWRRDNKYYVITK